MNKAFLISVRDKKEISSLYGRLGPIEPVLVLGAASIKDIVSECEHVYVHGFRNDNKPVRLENGTEVDYMFACGLEKFKTFKNGHPIPEPILEEEETDEAVETDETEALEDVVGSEDLNETVEVEPVVKAKKDGKKNKKR